MPETNHDAAFADWLDYHDEILRDFHDMLPTAVARALDYSMGSLDAIERWLLDRYASFERAENASETPVVDSVSRYVGEVIIRNAGGRWGVKTDDPDYAFFGIPEVEGFAGPADRICPLSLVLAATDRRTGHYLSSIAASIREDARSFAD